MDQEAGERAIEQRNVSLMPLLIETQTGAFLITPPFLPALEQSQINPALPTASDIDG
jgi:hypothetical protein